MPKTSKTKVGEERLFRSPKDLKGIRHEKKEEGSRTEKGESRLASSARLRKNGGDRAAPARRFCGSCISERRIWGARLSEKSERHGEEGRAWVGRRKRKHYHLIWGEPTPPNFYVSRGKSVSSKLLREKTGGGWKGTETTVRQHAEPPAPEKTHMHDPCISLRRGKTRIKKREKCVSHKIKQGLM